MLAVSIFVFAGLYHFANVPSFWYDELYTVGSIRSELTFKDTFNIYAHEEVNSPLYFFIAFFWYRLVPHTERALLSLSILFVIFASIITGLIGEKLRGIKFGILAFLFMLCNKSVFVSGAYEFRAYSLLLLVSAINLYFYLQRLHNESWLNIIFYGVTMCLLPYTHYVSVIFCFSMFIADCILIFRKRASIKIIISYFIGALLFLPWLILILPRMGNFSLSSWVKTPTLGSIFALCKWFCGANYPLEFPFGLAIIGFMYWLKISWKSWKSAHNASMNFLFSSVFAACFMVISVYVLNVFILPANPFFVNRYFSALIPVVSLIMALGTEYFYDKLKPVFMSKNIVIFAFIMFVFCLQGVFHMRHDNAGINKPYREVANIIYKSEQGYQGKSIILTTDGPIFFEGWKELYLTADNTRTCPNALSMSRLVPDSEILLKLRSGNYDRIYLSWLHIENKHTEIMKWLHSNYDFGDRPKDNRIGDYRFQILERRK